jgi:Skp family chaperone for outer membrane proteins
MDKRREVLMQFAVESDIPTEDTIAKYVAKYPEYETDIRELAAELQRWSDFSDDLSEETEEEKRKTEEAVTRSIFKYYEKLNELSGIKPGNA